MMTAEDWLKMRLTGADEIGLGTLLMIYVQCIACSSCHTNKCPTGITTQDVELQKKRFVGKEFVSIQRLEAQDEFQIEAGAKGVKNGLEALARDIQKGLAKMGITAEQFEKMVGDVGRLTQVETGNPVMDSLDLGSVLLASCNEPEWMSAQAMAGDTHESLANVYRNKAGDKILAEAERFLNGEVNDLSISLNIKSTDREIGTGLSGQIYERMERFGKLGPDQTITLNTEGEGGHNYGAYVGKGMVLRHEGFLNDSVGQAMSGNAKIIVRAHPELKEKSGHVLIGNQAGMWATGGTLYCPGRAGARLGVRNSGATIVAEGATDYPFEYMTAGEAYMLGDWVGEIGSRMTGGKLFVYDPEGNRREKISKAYIGEESMEEADFEAMHARMTDYYSETGSELVERILANWETEKFNFVKMMPKK
jgi:glutamate synthase (NADPH/NADH) large chain